MNLVKVNNRRVSDPWNDLFDGLFRGMEGGVTARNWAKHPSVNVAEDDHHYQLEFLVPGFKKEDFKIEVENNMLNVSASVSKEEAEQANGKKYMRKEFSYQSFKRSFELPETADGDHISASYEAGVLTLDIAKKAEEKVAPKQIEVK